MISALLHAFDETVGDTYDQNMEDSDREDFRDIVRAHLPATTQQITIVGNATFGSMTVTMPPKR
jgi:hypothetical protein